MMKNVFIPFILPLQNRLKDFLLKILNDFFCQNNLNIFNLVFIKLIIFVVKINAAVKYFRE